MIIQEQILELLRVDMPIRLVTGDGRDNSETQNQDISQAAEGSRHFPSDTMGYTVVVAFQRIRIPMD